MLKSEKHNVSPDFYESRKKFELPISVNIFIIYIGILLYRFTNFLMIINSTIQIL